MNLRERTHDSNAICEACAGMTSVLHAGKKVLDLNSQGLAPGNDYFAVRGAGVDDNAIRRADVVEDGPSMLPEHLDPALFHRACAREEQDGTNAAAKC
jgi:hypothetical protein